MQIMKNLFSVVILAVVIFASCKKADVSDQGQNPPQSTPPATTLADKMKDTALGYSQDIYLWNTQIPGNFDARSYSDLDKLMNGIRKYSTEPGFSAPVDRWSFAMKQSEWDNVSSGVSGDFGINVFFRSQSDLRVKIVEENSPAGKAGIRRGWRITAINGNTNINTSNVDFVVQTIFQSNAVKLTLTKPDNSSTTIDLVTGSYQTDPTIIDSVYTIDSKKIGYLAFNSFLGDTTQMFNDFNRVFSNFASKGVNDVIIDLRYNGGGYVNAAQKLDNWLAPQAANGQLMMKQQFNAKYTEWNESTNFQKLGNLNLNRIFFIVGSGTASASELLINNLKPFMDVQIVGASATYGKPVGFFPIPVGDWYIFPVSFRSTNKDGQGNYFDGLPLNNQVSDGLDKDWGDTQEASLASVIKYIVSGAYPGIASNGRNNEFQQQPDVIRSNTTLDAPSFKGTVAPRTLPKRF